MSSQNQPDHIFCSTCGTQNDRGQKFCSNCGNALAPTGGQTAEAAPAKKKSRRGCFIGVGVVVLLGICGLIASTMLSGGDGATTSSQTSGSESAAPRTYGVGEDVQVDEVRWKIIEVVDEGDTIKSGNQFIDDLTTSGKFVRVTFEMENLSKDMLSFAGLNLTDDQDREFIPSSDAIMLIESGQACILENLNPNVPKTCISIYEIPANANGLSAKVSDLKPFGNKEALVDLGLDS